MTGWRAGSKVVEGLAGVGPDGAGGVAPLCRCVELESVLAVLWETAEGRRRVHRANQVRDSCDTRLVVAGRELMRGGAVALPRVEAARSCLVCGRTCVHQPAPVIPAGVAYRLVGDCPCAAFLADALASMFCYLAEQGATLRNPPAAVRRHVRTRQHDHVRAGRLARGAQVRTDRLIDGAIGQRLATDEQRHLLRDCADEAGSDAPLESDDHLLLRLATLRARRRGGEPALALDPALLIGEVRRDREIVRTACLANRLVNVGTHAEPELVDWWEAFVERPLGRRRRASDLSLDQDRADEKAPWVPTGPIGEAGAAQSSVEDFGEALLEALRRTDDGTLDPAALLGRALAALSRGNGIDAGTVNGFLADDARRAAALDAIAQLQQSWRVPSRPRTGAATG